MVRGHGQPTGAYPRGLSQGVPLDLEGSDVAGSLAAVAYGTNLGPYNPVGVELTGTFPAGTVIHVKGNTRIVGGDAVAPCNNHDGGQESARTRGSRSGSRSVQHSPPTSTAASTRRRSS